MLHSFLLVANNVGIKAMSSSINVVPFFDNSGEVNIDLSLLFIRNFKENLGTKVDMIQNAPPKTPLPELTIRMVVRLLGMNS